MFGASFLTPGDAGGRLPLRWPADPGLLSREVDSKLAARWTRVALRQELPLDRGDERLTVQVTGADVAVGGWRGAARDRAAWRWRIVPSADVDGQRVRHVRIQVEEAGPAVGHLDRAE